MIRKIVRDTFFLSQPSVNVQEADELTANDLLDTLKYHQKECVGMAANMIGVRKCIIAIKAGSIFFVMYNPQIVDKQDEYVAYEGCLCLDDERPVKRYRQITLVYRNQSFKECRQQYQGFIAQIIQHEIDHCRGVII